VQYFLRIIICSLFIVLFSATCNAGYLTNIRIIKSDKLTRVIFSLNDEIQPHVVTANDQVIIDFDNTRLGEYLNHLHLPTNEINSIKNVSNSGNNLRLILQIKPGCRVDSMPKEKTNRLVIDIDSKNAVNIVNPQPKTQLITNKKIISHDIRTPQPMLMVKKSHTIAIVVDAGHGGKDPGAVGEHGTKEKDVVLGIAQRLATLINQQPHMRAILTRDGDYFVPLRDRIRLARKDKADLFMSIHADSYFNTLASGASIYALSHRGASSEAARWLAQRENYSELGGVDLGELNDQSVVLRSVLIDLAQTATITDSLRLGNVMLNSVHGVAKLRYPRVEQAPFVVLKSPDIPSILVETGFISNGREELHLRDKKYQSALAQALFDGLNSYIKKNLQG